VVVEAEITEVQVEVVMEIQADQEAAEAIEAAKVQELLLHNQANQVVQALLVLEIQEETEIQDGQEAEAEVQAEADNLLQIQA
jgi:hypothetical protein